MRWCSSRTARCWAAIPAARSGCGPGALWARAGAPYWVGEHLFRRDAAYLLSREDVLCRTDFAGGGFYGGWYMDFHSAGGMKEAKYRRCAYTLTAISSLSALLQGEAGGKDAQGGPRPRGRKAAREKARATVEELRSMKMFEAR